MVCHLEGFSSVLLQLSNVINLKQIFSCIPIFGAYLHEEFSDSCNHLGYEIRKRNGGGDRDRNHPRLRKKWLIFLNNKDDIQSQQNLVEWKVVSRYITKQYLMIIQSKTTSLWRHHVLTDMMEQSGFWPVFGKNYGRLPISEQVFIFISYCVNTTKCCTKPIFCGIDAITVLTYG